jgi:hypothetical protein
VSADCLGDAGFKTLHPFTDETIDFIHYSAAVFF